MGPETAASTGILHPRLPSEKERIAREFQTSEPFLHVVIPDFFSPEFCRRMVDEFPSFEGGASIDEHGEKGRKATYEDVRGISDTYRRLDDSLQTPDFLDLMSEITGIPGLLYDPDYHGGGTHENLHGQGLYPHVDFNYHPRGWHRRANLIVYLNPEWEEEWGGSLELHSNPWDPSEDRVEGILPVLNRGVLFETTEHSWHGFREITLPADRRHLSRRSFAIYLYSEERPPEHTVPAHTVFYVPDGLPDDLEPGSVLTEEQYRLLHVRFTNYRRTLELAYDGQKQLSERIANELDAGRSLFRLDLQGYAVQTRAPTGWWIDRWASPDFSMEFRATRPVQAVLLEVWVPPQLGSDQVLHIRAGEWNGVETVAPDETRALNIPVRVDTNETLEVAIHADHAWAEADGRPLAYLIVSAVLEH